MKHIVLTGGGTAGHVTPNIAMIPRLKELGYKISYIGSYDGIEKKLIEELDIPYYGICLLYTSTLSLDKWQPSEYNTRTSSPTSS